MIRIIVQDNYNSRCLPLKMVIYVLTVCLYSGFTLASYPSCLLQKLFLLLAT